MTKKERIKLILEAIKDLSKAEKELLKWQAEAGAKEGLNLPLENRITKLADFLHEVITIFDERMNSMDLATTRILTLMCSLRFHVVLQA